MENQEQISNKNQSIVSIGDWFITILISGIPFIGFIMLLVWAFSSSTPVSKSNWAKAMLIFMVIFTVIAILFWSVIIAAIIGSHNSL